MQGRHNSICIINSNQFHYFASGMIYTRFKLLLLGRFPFPNALGIIADTPWPMTYTHACVVLFNLITSLSVADSCDVLTHVPLVLFTMAQLTWFCDCSRFDEKIGWARKTDKGLNVWNEFSWIFRFCEQSMNPSLNSIKTRLDNSLGQRLSITNPLVWLCWIDKNGCAGYGKIALLWI